MKIIKQSEYCEETGRKLSSKIGKCSCGEEVELTFFTNTCPRCDRDYNMDGALLMPREAWGEETGEHWSECY